ncbi:hypothetical protein LK994_03145 [Ferruginibacter lapsinanis]|uniref:hypothetical protein n=1 Tax=Ferruginibacter lapsinanis TaxID=563172 RepID=UPI001E4435CE|nr:hypothetical protein [Ferruginibacter lapsinanis]UEG50471.1 hypothetical protein LK994_03145 [Ferruginibacter lapsinanis]
MERSTDILNELKDISPLLAEIGRENIFSVPQGYFDNISDTVLICIKEEHGISTTVNTGSVPQGYFDNLASSILDKIKNQPINATDEIRELSPVLHSIQHKNVFEVPVNYFADLPETISSKTQTKQTGKLVRMSSRIAKYAVAAMLTGAVALGVYKLFDKPVNIVQVEQSQAFATLDPIIEQGKNMNDKQFNETLNNLSEEAIAKYLEKNASEKDVAVLVSSIDQSSLPNEDDYLLDEKTLEKYLSSTNN